jgi:hypothetical protein
MRHNNKCMGVKKVFWATAVFLAIPFISGAVASAQGIYQSGTNGVDVSYPNCGSSVPSTDFGIVGVTGGLPFRPNNCLVAEASHFRNLSFYINTAYPGQSYGLKYQTSPNSCASDDLTCLAYNYGYNAGQYATSYAKNQGLSASTWWLDVETMNSWTPNAVQNVQSLQGMTDALKTAGTGTVGIYSTTAQWGTITGGWQNGYPNWGASTWKTARQAKTFCNGHEFTGGPTYLIQYKGKNLDQDYAC